MTDVSYKVMIVGTTVSIIVDCKNVDAAQKIYWEIVDKINNGETVTISLGDFKQKLNA